MHWWDSNQGPLTYKKVKKTKKAKKSKKTKKQKRNALPGFEPGTFWLQKQCSNLYATETSQLNFVNK